MRNGSLFLLLGWMLLGGAARLHGDEPNPVPSVQALEKVMQQGIAQAEPSIACILVSRNEVYRKLDPTPPDETTGRLGIFNPNPNLLNQKLGFTSEQLKKLDLADPDAVPESFGSGVVVDPRGLILTNYHVVRDAVKVFVRLPGNRASYADIHAADPRSDLAILRLLTPGVLPLKAITLGDGGKLQRGQFILTLANPFAAGFRDGQPSASWGIVSNLRRCVAGPPAEVERIRPLHSYGTLVQIDARLNMGCSGGALLNLQGELVGLTTAVAAIHGTDTPGGFAIPLDSGFRRILDVLVRGEEVDYGFLGVSFNNKPDPGPGVGVTIVVEGSPAREAGLQVHDRILAINGVPITEPDDIFLQLGTNLAGSKVRLEVRRAFGGLQTLDATLAKFSYPGKRIASSLGKRPFFRGLRVDYSSLLAQQSPTRIPRGVMVTEVQPGSPAAQAKLRYGDVISHINGQAISTPANFYQVIANLRGPIDLTLPTAPTEPGNRNITVKLEPS